MSERLPPQKFDPSSAFKPVRELRQLTGGNGQPKDIDFGDPSAPDFTHPAGVRVYTTAGHVLTWSRAKYGNRAIEAFFRGENPDHEMLDLRHADGTRLKEEKHGEDGWDPTIVRDPKTRKEILYASVMTPPPGKRNATWPEDNWSRRVYAFHKARTHWVRSEDPLWGEVPTTPSWIGHNYGHHFIKDAKGESYVFYERVTEEKDGHPWKTELFARKMESSTGASEIEISILKIPEPPWKRSVRSFGGSLVEGPRPFKIGDFYFVSFSAGEYMSPNYGIHLLWSKTIEGPYAPYLNSRRTDLRDFGRDVESGRRLTWGAARATFFEYQGRWWTLFHGIKQSEKSKEPDQGFRNLYLAPVEVTDLGPAKPPGIRILKTAE